MFEINDFAEELRQWASQHKLEEHALECFFGYIENYRKEEPEEFEQTFPGFDKDNFDVHVQKVALSLNWQKNRDDDRSIVAHIPIVYCQAEIGWYRVEYSMLGEILDDWWYYHK